MNTIATVKTRDINFLVIKIPLYIVLYLLCSFSFVKNYTISAEHMVCLHFIKFMKFRKYFFKFLHIYLYQIHNCTHIKRQRVLPRRYLHKSQNRYTHSWTIDLAACQAFSLTCKLRPHCICHAFLPPRSLPLKDHRLH